MGFKLKFGILLASVWAASQSKQRVICESLFHAINRDYQVDDNCSNRCKGFMRNIPAEIVENINSVSTISIRRNLRENVSNLIINSKGLIEYLMWVLRNDDSIDSEVKIGFQDSITKNEYLAKTVFNLDEVLADFLIFTVLRNENKDEELNKLSSELTKKSISKKIKEFQEKSSFKIVYDDEGDISNLPITTKIESFDDVFTKVADGSIDIPNPNEVRAYILNTNVYSLDYSDLTDLVMDNICSYVYSREEIRNDGQDRRAISKSVLRASQELRNQANDDQLGQILIYIFLEKVLGAPKLMSKIEMKDNYINGDGLFLNSTGPDKYQIVIGSSKLFDDAIIAIDELIKKVDVVVENGILNPNKLLVDVNFMAHFSTNELQNLRNILVPSKGKHLRTTAFGLFIGYTSKVDKNLLNSLSEEKAEKYIKDCTQRDLELVIEHLNKEISKNGLQRYSFYVYMMPFTDVKIDSDRIMYEVRGGVR